VIVLADNDVLLKLACCDLYGELLAAFGVTTADVLILNTARFVLDTRKVRTRLDAASMDRLRAFLAAVQDVTIAPDPVEQVALAEQPRIDAGEAVLFSVAPLVPDSLLATGDKRSLLSLTEAATTNAVCAGLCARLAGKVVCFEQIIHRIVDHHGFESVRAKLIAGRESDRVLAILLGSGLDASEATVREGLASYVNDLRRGTGTLLVP
jgi:hypothetical protein